MRELEVKYRISNLEIAKKEFAKYGIKLIDEVRQSDNIYLLPGTSFQNLKGQNVLRIREEINRDSSMKNYSFSLKTYKERKLDRIEHETNISEPTELENIIFQLGYIKVLNVTKQRIKLKDGEYNICLDKVDKLGEFIEVEVLLNSDVSYNGVREKINIYLLDKKIQILEEITKPYDTLINELG